MRLGLCVSDEANLGLEPLSALNAVPLAQAGQIFGCLSVLILFEVLGRQHVGFDLVEVAQVPPRLGQRALIADAHLVDLLGDAACEIESCDVASGSGAQCCNRVLLVVVFIGGDGTHPWSMLIRSFTDWPYGVEGKFWWGLRGRPVCEKRSS